MTCSCIPADRRLSSNLLTPRGLRIDARPAARNEAGSPPAGIVGASNPINVSQPGFGGTPIQNEGGGYYLYSYPAVRDGVEAIAVYLARPSYTGILAALKAGAGLS